MTEGTTGVEREATRLRDHFAARGARVVGADVLLPADALLDLYGEDIRARAYLTADPLRGEMVLRPDFTVPVVQMHLSAGAAPARYTYAGKVFRKQDSDETRPNEYLQVGYEVFDGDDPADADAEVFAAIAAALQGLPARAATGDIGILTAAVNGLKTSAARKAALLRHIWRPGRFKSLLKRFGSGKLTTPRAALLASDDPFADLSGPDIGVRRRSDVAARLDALRADAEQAPISAEEIALIDAILGMRETMPNVFSALSDIAVDMPAIQGALDKMAQRMEALANRGIDVDSLAFEGSYGRTQLEYYDGFVFGFAATDRSGLPAIATGGRYDALTAQLGGGRPAPAVGGVIRPELALEVGTC